MTDQIAVCIPGTQTVVSKYYFPLRGTRGPLKAVQSLILDTTGIALKGLKKQLENVPTGQTWSNLNFSKNNNGNRLRHIKYV